MTLTMSFRQSGFPGKGSATFRPYLAIGLAVLVAIYHKTNMVSTEEFSQLFIQNYPSINGP